MIPGATPAKLAERVYGMRIDDLLILALVRLTEGDRDMAETFATVAVEKLALERLRKQ